MNRRKKYIQLQTYHYQAFGEKAAEMCHGQFTNHIKGLKDQEANYNLYLSVKGKVLGDLYIAKDNDHFDLLIDDYSETEVVNRLKLMAPFSKVEIKNKKKENLVFHLLEDLTGEIKNDFNNSLKSYQTNRYGQEGYDIILSSEKRSDFLNALHQDGWTCLSEEEKETIRIENGIAILGIDCNEKNLPQEARLDRALHFEKGCYLGQEIIARLHYKGHVNKILSILVSDDAKYPKKNETIIHEKKEIGSITSSTYSEKYKKGIALGYIPYKLYQEDPHLTSSDGIKLSLKKASPSIKSL